MLLSSIDNVKKKRKSYRIQVTNVPAPRVDTCYSDVLYPIDILIVCCVILFSLAKTKFIGWILSKFSNK